MMMHVKNVPVFLDFLRSLGKFVPGCRFTVSGTGLAVRAINGKIRVFMETDSVVSSEDIVFSFSDIQKLIKTISMVQKVEAGENMDMEYDGIFLSHEGVTKFRLATTKDEHNEKIDKYVTTDLKNELIPIASFRTSSDRIKMVIQHMSMISSTDARLYMIWKNDAVMCELEDRKNPAGDCIGIPISNSMTGDFGGIIPLTYESFKAMNLVESDDIKISYTDQMAVDMQCIKKTGDHVIKVRVVSLTVKP